MSDSIMKQISRFQSEISGIDLALRTCRENLERLEACSRKITEQMTLLAEQCLNRHALEQYVEDTESWYGTNRNDFADKIGDIYNLGLVRSFHRVEGEKENIDRAIRELEARMDELICAKIVFQRLKRNAESEMAMRG